MNIVVLVLDEINERAAEEALRLMETADAHAGDTTTDGGASAVPAVVADLLACPR